MKKIMTIFALLFVFFSPVLSADSMLKISVLSGEVDCSVSGSDWKPAVLNQELNTNDKIRTKNGKAELLFAEGTTIKIKENSFLDLLKIQCSVQRQKSSLKLLFGGIKAKVTKLGAGGSFDVSSPKVIAAVKGTEFVMEISGENTELQVLEGVVAISELLKEKEIFVRENEKAAFRDGFLENPRQMDPAEILGIRESFEISGITGLGSRTAGLSGAELEKEAKELKELRSDLADLKDRSNLEDKQDLLERISDVQLGKTAVDMHGFRVRTDNYVLRPLPNVLQLLNITKREGGPDAGLSSFEINDTFNKDLPANYMDVKTAIRDSVNGITLSGGNPDYWLKIETAAIRNPHGDVILNEVGLSDPSWNSASSMYEQPFNETFKINGNLKWSHDYSAGFQETYTDNNPSGAVTTTVTAADPALPYTVISSITSDNAFLIKTTFADNTYLETYRYYVNDSGVIQPLTLDKYAETLSKPNLNWELIYKATEFGTRSIDLLIIPEIFSQLF
ncbi:MAG: FecR family protein [Candidatus Firestonebacteria bacterium]